MNLLQTIRIEMAVNLLLFRGQRVFVEEMKAVKLDETITSGNNVYVKVMGE